MKASPDKKRKRKITGKQKLRNEIDAWVLMLPMVVILYLFVWRPTVLGGAWSFFNMRAYNIQDF